MNQQDRITAKFQDICLTILQDSRRELYLGMRYLDVPLSSLMFQVTTELAERGFGTDGQVLAVHPKALADLYDEDKRLVNRMYLHEVLHCLLRHPFKVPREDQQLWRLACDIAVESMIDSMHVRCVRTGVSRFRRNWYDLLHTSLKVLTAEGIYHTLKKKELTMVESAELMMDFCIDEHVLWPSPQDPQKPPTPQLQMLQDKWQDLAEKTQTQMESFAKDQAQGAGDLENTLRIENRQRYDYKNFLRKFSVLREVVSIDPDSFDYVFYTFGLSLYGNMPLIEPLESRSVRRIEEFVIVLDVSMSTSGELVKSFLEQTYSVLTEKETYLHKVNIHILQCDEEVLEDVRITDRKQLEEYREHFVLRGGGGTDFRPAFAYVDELIAAKQLRDLKGLIYFTDGRGIYPKRKRSYETAFVFLQEDYADADVPPWAMKLILEKEDLEPEETLRTDYRFID